VTKQPEFVLRILMHGAIPPLPQYASMEWCSVKSYLGMFRESIAWV